MARMTRSIRLRAGAVLVPLCLCACASGESNLEKLFKGIHPADALAVAGAVWLAHEYAQPWSERVVDQGAGRFRVEVARAAWSGGGEGDFGRRFGAIGERTCGSFRVLSYRERFEPEQFAGARRIGEGVIECQDR